MRWKVTNSKIRNKAVVENYRNLSFIDRAFRMNKTDLAIRPIYHRLFNSIEAHVCICFTAYTILLELERTLLKAVDKKNKKPGITIYRAKFLAESLYNIESTERRDPSCSAQTTMRRSRSYWMLSVENTKPRFGSPRCGKQEKNGGGDEIVQVILLTLQQKYNQKE